MDLEKYLDTIAIKGEHSEARVIDPGSVVTSAWVRWKCQFGCPVYGKGYCCPPDSPPPEETRKMLDCYQRAILFHFEVPPKEGRSRRKLLNKFYRQLVDLEGELFKDGYYKAFVFLAGHCDLCKECQKPKGEPCSQRARARPSMEACGIDVYETSRNNGFVISPVRLKSETWNFYSLLLVD